MILPNRHFILRAGITLLFLVLVACTPDTVEDKGHRTLRREFIAANQAETIAPLLALYHLEGCDDTTRTLLKGALQYELGLPIKEISFEPLTGAPEETIHYTHNGVTYGPTLKPTYRMRVIYNVKDGFTSLFSIGQTREGIWRITSSKPLPEPKL
ncbi:MAG: hypothetical protein ACSHX8_02915 [Opitutaceae bacterium]